MEAKELYFLKHGFVPKYSRGKGQGSGVARWAAQDRSGLRKSTKPGAWGKLRMPSDKL